MAEQRDLSHPDEWIDRYGDYLFRYALLRVRQTHIAEDLLQDTLLAAFQSRRSFSGRSQERVWLVGILKHKISDYYRKASQEGAEDRNAHIPEEWTASFDDRGHWKREDMGPREWTMDPGAVLERREFWEALNRCLGELPSRQASAYSLREIEGLKGNEVCEKLDISESNLWVILYRVRLHLRRCLEIKWQGREP
jgi:RNA polymerase sigma-70 factor, ECF subfamily